MRLIRRLLPLACCCLMSGACVIDTVHGSGTVVTEPRTVSGFTAVAMSGSSRLLVEQTGTESLTVTADDNLLPYIRTEVRGDQLQLGFTDGMMGVRPTKPIVFTLTVKSLDELDVSGSGTVDAKALSASRLRLGVSGSGSLQAQGTADDLRVSISGSGAFFGRSLNAARASVDISGSGAALVAADDRLDASVSGSGAVEYIGNPRITQHVSGSGYVRHRN